MGCIGHGNIHTACAKYARVVQCKVAACFGSSRVHKIKVCRLSGHKNQGDKEIIIITALGQRSTSTASVRRPCKYKLYWKLMQIDEILVDDND